MVCFIRWSVCPEALGVLQVDSLRQLNIRQAAYEKETSFFRPMLLPPSCNRYDQPDAWLQFTITTDLLLNNDILTLKISVLIHPENIFLWTSVRMVS